jgi:hypothetical protein
MELRGPFIVAPGFKMNKIFIGFENERTTIDRNAPLLLVFSSFRFEIYERILVF